MKTLLDYVFEDLIEDIEKWHKEYHDEEDTKEGLENLIDILDDYKKSSESDLRNIDIETEEDTDEIYYKNKYPNNF